jgi:hypothetical protein
LNLYFICEIKPGIKKSAKGNKIKSFGIINESLLINGVAINVSKTVQIIKICAYEKSLLFNIHIDYLTSGSQSFLDTFRHKNTGLPNYGSPVF